VQRDNAQVIEATNYLRNEVIPKFAGELTQLLIEARDKGYDVFRTFRLTEAVHMKGINVRYFGLLRSHMTQLDCRTLLLVEVGANNSREQQPLGGINQDAVKMCRCALGSSRTSYEHCCAIA
jgi:hypothetical protein